MDTLLTKVYALYGMNRTQFSKHRNIPYKTLEGWESSNTLPNQGKLLIEALIELKELEIKHQEELSQYKDKAERFDAIQRALTLQD